MGLRHGKHASSAAKRRTPIPPKVRDLVWKTYHGSSNKGICYCCGTNIDRHHGGWHCSHVKADAKGGTSALENLRTCCRFCNLSMGDQNLYVYIQQRNLKGPGVKNVNRYLFLNLSQYNDRRTNNWRKSK